MLLIIQAILALIATFRGHGFKPWAVMLTAVLVGVGLGFMGVTNLVLYLMFDIIAAVFIAGFAFSPAEG